MKTFPLATTLMLGCVLVAAPRSVAQASLLEALPADCMSVLTVDDVDALKASLAESAMGKLWHDAALDAVRDELGILMGEADDDAVEQMGVSPFELLGMVHGGACIAVVAYEPRAIDDGIETDAAVAWMFDTGEDLDAFSESFDRFVDWVVETEGLVFKTESYGDIDVAVMVDPEHDDVEFRYGFVDSILLITAESVVLERDVFGEIVDGLAGESEASFAQDSAYPESVAAGPGADIRLWVDLGEFLRRTWDAEGADAPSELGLEFDELGFTKLGALAMGAGFSERGSLVTGLLEFIGGGWIQDVVLAGVGQQDPNLSQWMPDSASSAFAMDLDMGAMFDAFLGLTMDDDPDEARDIIAGMAEMESEIGFHLRDDLLDNLDGQLGYFIAEVPVDEGLPGPGGTPPVNYAALLGLQDGEAMSAMLDGLVRSQGLHAARQLYEFEGYTMYVVPFFGMQACYAVLDDLAVLSLSPSMVKDVLRRKSNPELPTILAIEDVKTREALLPAERTMAGYQDAAEQMSAAFVGVATMMPLILDSMEVDLDEDFALLGLMDAVSSVDPDVIEKYYRDTYSLSSVTVSPQGLLMVSSGP